MKQFYRQKNDHILQDGENYADPDLSLLYGSCPTSTISITSQCQDKMFIGSYESTDVDASGFSTYEMIGNSDFKLAFNSTSEVRG